MFEKIIAFFISIIVSVFGAFNCGQPSGEPVETDKKYDNVIIMIGDGMGYNHLYSTEHEYGISLDMLTRTPYHGFSKTRSASSSVTDSAAGGTALATGVRTMNGYIGVYPTDPAAVLGYPASITEVAQKYGKSTGVVTSDSVTGATPAAFSAHVSSRTLSDAIIADQLDSDIDLLWGHDSGEVKRDAVAAAGFTYCESFSQVQALVPGQRSIGQFDTDTLWRGTDNGDEPTLSELTGEALRLLNADEDGFFLMVEGAHIDKNSHNRDGDNAMIAVLEFNKAVNAALDFAEADGNTLVIITADHETGAVTLQDDGSYKWTIGSHSSANVPVLVYGCDEFIEDGETVENRDIPRLAVGFMTGGEQSFPISYQILSGEKTGSNLLGVAS